MTKGLLQSSLNWQNMRKMETGKTNSNLYKSYRNLYNRLVRIAKTMHYTSLIDRYKGDVAKTWQVLNDITGKRKIILEQPMQPYMHITQDKEISPTSLKHLALYLKEQLLIKGQKFGQKYHKQSDYIKTRILSLDY